MSWRKYHPDALMTALETDIMVSPSHRGISYS